MSHLPRSIGYDPGNLLTYVPLYAKETSTKDLITEHRVYESFFYETTHRSFRCRSYTVALAQRNCLNDLCVYVVNRKSLMVNKTQMNYSDDSSNVLCAPLSINMLKWTESFMGDAIMYDWRCKYEEPLRRIVLDFDYPKVSHFRVASNDYSFSPPSNTHIRGRRIECRDYDAMSILMYQSIPSLTIRPPPPQVTPGNSHILVAPGV